MRYASRLGVMGLYVIIVCNELCDWKGGVSWK